MAKEVDLAKEVAENAPATEVSPRIETMEIILGIAALALLIVSFLGLLKVLCRIFAVLCVIGAVCFWVSGGKDKLATGLETGLSTVLEQAADLGGEDRWMLEAAIRNPESVLGPQKRPRFKNFPLIERLDMMLEDPEGHSGTGAKSLYLSAPTSCNCIAVAVWLITFSPSTEE